MSEAPSNAPDAVGAALACAVGGLWMGSALGLVELTWLWRGGVDLSIPVWAFGLYGLAGMALGLVSAVVVGVGVRVAGARPLARRVAVRGLALGAATALFPLGVVLGRYVLNRDLFAEAMPLWATGVLVGGVGLLAFMLAWLPVPLRRTRLPASKLGLPGVLVGAGAWVAGLFLAFGLSFGAPGVDRSTWAADGQLPAQLADKPDVLLITVDTLRGDHLDHPGLDTPHLDRLRADAITFDNAYSASSWTRPGFATLWTSRLPSSHTATTKGSRLPNAAVTWAEVLHAHQIRTGALVNNINVTASFGFDQGFDTFHYEAPAYPFGATEGVFGLALYKVVHRVEERLGGGGDVTRYYQPADVVLDDALAWIDAQGQSRWALSVHLMEPHDPYFGTDGHGYARAAHPDPAPVEADQLRTLYGQEVERLDAKLGAFLDALRERGRYDDLAIVLTADHGEEFHEHGGWWHGSALYTEQTHVPLVVKLPDNRLGGQRVPWQVRTLDVPPTLTGLLDLSPDPSWEGEDLLPDVIDRVRELALEDPPGPPEDLLDPSARCIRERGDRHDRTVVLELDFEGNEATGVRESGMAWYAAKPGGSRELPASELYDVLEDPGETHNLVESGHSVCSWFPEDWVSSLEIALRAEQIRGGPLEGSQVEISEAERQRLCALGYLTGAECE